MHYLYLKLPFQPLPSPLVAGLLCKDDNGERRHLSKIPVEHSRISNDGPLNFTVTGGVTEYFAKT